MQLRLLTGLSTIVTIGVAGALNRVWAHPPGRHTARHRRTQGQADPPDLSTEDSEVDGDAVDPSAAASFGPGVTLPDGVPMMGQGLPPAAAIPGTTAVTPPTPATEVPERLERIAPVRASARVAPLSIITPDQVPAPADPPAEPAPEPPIQSFQAQVPVGPAAWLPARAAPVIVAGHTLRGGLIYLGQGLKAVNAPGPEPALIDPDAIVDSSRPDSRRRAAPALSYATLSPAGRDAYLRWLADGRTGRAAPDNLFLFLYGLERRVFADLLGSGTAREYLAIGGELRRLAEAYQPGNGGPKVFHRTATDLLVVVDTLAMTAARDLLAPPPPELPTTGLTPALRVGLARFLAARRPVPPEWAFAWHAHHADRRWRAPATRCREEFTRTFGMHYKLVFPDGGMVVTQPQKQLILSYTPTSPGFAGRRISIRTGLPDISQMEDNVRVLHSIAERAQHDLEAYARLIARRPQARGTPEALGLLPLATAQVIAARPVGPGR